MKLIQQIKDKLQCKVNYSSALVMASNCIACDIARNTNTNNVYTYEELIDWFYDCARKWLDKSLVETNINKLLILVKNELRKFNSVYLVELKDGNFIFIEGKL